ncbi:flagellar hook-associated protein FlgK [Listeria ivanovii]|uniref:flagellar hook-associated protein FlgK n=1 Tax=Listeria ivanovii TaxID=1638 RepID=UPI000DAA06DB|nr:flagellar hook-associated protein FlgK [Listeria ivanovii]PZG40581.1 flagellar hook-associated protein FlgK [Listeria ivanovii]
MRLSDFNTSLSGMSAAQIANMVAQQNISNMNTPGYIRQAVDQQALYSDGGLLGGNKQTGYGVKVTDIKRLTNVALTTQYNNQIAKQSASLYESGALNQALNLFGTPGKNTPSDNLDNFFTAWGALAKNPDQATNTTALLSSMTIFTDQLNQLHSGLKELETTITADTEAALKDLNTLIKKLGSINKAIGNAGSNPPNDLLNQRDQILTTMSGYAGISVSAHPNNPDVYDVTIGGRLVVQGDETTEITSTRTASGFEFSVSGQTLNMPAGSISASVRVNQNEIKSYQDKIETFSNGLAKALDDIQVKNVNKIMDDLQKIGDALQANPNDEKLLSNCEELLRQLEKFPGVTRAGDTIDIGGTSHSIDSLGTSTYVNDVSDFSIPIFVQNAGKWTINPTITNNAENKPFLGVIAADIASLKIDKNIEGTTFPNFMDGIITEVATDASKSSATSTADSQALSSLSESKSSLEGVNIDEEMTNIMQYQSYYVANTKAMNTVNDMMKALLAML